jgi:hypothetical protein
MKPEVALVVFASIGVIGGIVCYLKLSSPLANITELKPKHPDLRKG